MFINFFFYLENIYIYNIYIMNVLNNTTKSIGTTAKSIYNKLPDGKFGKIIKAIIGIIIVIIMVNLSKNMFRKYKKWQNSTIWLLKNTKSAKQGRIIYQDPIRHEDDAKTLMRSENENGGIEFTYVLWLHIDDWTYEYNKWKHVFHKGNSTSWPLRAPGVWLHPKENILRVYMNSFKAINEYVDVSNIPMHKWFHVAICVRQRNLDIFFNGNLVKRKVLEGLPKQNYGDVYINSFNGFSGYLSRFKYYNYYISYSELVNHLNRGPSMMPCVDTNEMPPYLTPNWWSNNN